MNAAFVGTPLPARRRPSPIIRPHIALRPPQMTLSARVSQRARDDIALLQAASKSLLTTAAISAAILSTSIFPAYAEVPATPPGTFLFDDAAIIQKGNASLFTKAVSNIKVKQGVTVRFVFAKSLPYNETPDEYAAELAEQWGLGASDLLFVASPKLARAGAYVGSEVPNVTAGIVESICNETYAVPAGEERYGAALLEVSNRVIGVLGGEDPGPPDMTVRETVQTYKTKGETQSDKKKYVTVVVAVLAISIIAPLIQTYWYVRDD